MSIFWAKQTVSSKDFLKFFSKRQYINEGSDGAVSQWVDNDTGEMVAVKEPKPDRAHKNRSELVKFLKVPFHENVVRFLGSISYHDWATGGPVLIFEFCGYGDVYEYRKRILNHEIRVPEISVWKLMRDLSLALDWVHNRCEQSYVLGDLKPENVLVFPEASWDGKGAPLLPTFKICDFGRMERAGETNKYLGTPEFGPPMAEREIQQTCEVDVFALGCTVHWMALGEFAQMPGEQFVKYAKEKHGFFVKLAQLLGGDQREMWRTLIPPYYRPLNASMEEQKKIWSLDRPVPPFSTILNKWYTELFEEDPKRRIGSEALVEFFVPVADLQIERLKAQRALVIAADNLAVAGDTLEAVKARYL